ncbi:surface antigen msp4 family protein [Chlorobaculum parvum NCIB 8327]|uniref:Surface antigen msp4 family protein n=1 Tax=Chlorobaculum parvum (strain DSM 263 / NCIMB 8327) TaxID=517417 RepID=B3QQN6_CHLP8|nr:outer membrane beta-barrel protein [Chlorobaculum parvum]ACF12239.1 surface antigen msp4 family protein [Chlorobaculum parvum NCIB 8327]
MKKKLLALVAVLLATGAWSSTGYSAGNYVSANAGISWFGDAKLTDNADDEENFCVDLDSGIALTGAYGHDYGDYRIEAELGYQRNDIAKSIDYLYGSVYDEYSMTGNMSVISLMGNAYYDINLTDDLELFLTAGAGAAFVSFNDVGDVDDDFRYDKVTATAFAYQLGAGLSYKVAENLRLEARYRYFATADFTIDDTANFWDDYAEDDYMNTVKNISSSSVMLGLRLSL